MRCTVIWFSVSVPVLSEQMTVVLPRVSTAGSLRMMARRRAILDTPMARVMVTAAGRPSGMAPTASATAARNMSTSGSPRNTPTTAVITANPRMMIEQQPAELGYLAGERGLDLVRGGDEAGDAPDLGGVAGRDHHAGPLSGGGQCGGVGHVGPIGQRGLFG